MKRRDLLDLLLYTLAVAALLSVAMCGRASSFEVEGTKMPTTITYRCSDPDLKSLFLEQFEQWNAAASHIFTLQESDSPILEIMYCDIIYPYPGYTYIFDDGSATIVLYPPTEIGIVYNAAPVMLHEIGHALGLAHSPSIAAIMYYEVFPYTQPTLWQDDIDGIRFIYGLSPVQLDELQFKCFGRGRNRRFVTAGYSVLWSFGDGSPSAVGRRVRHRFPAHGIYTVTATYLGVSQSESVSVLYGRKQLHRRSRSN